ncbi:MAG: hypothetical protein ACLU99_08685 [Alphaproteobacteria bacterium]
MTTPPAKPLTRSPGNAGLGHPGGPIIEKMAELGNENRFVLPRPPPRNSNDCNMSLFRIKNRQCAKSMNSACAGQQH